MLIHIPPAGQALKGVSLATCVSEHLEKCASVVSGRWHFVVVLIYIFLVAMQIEVLFLCLLAFEVSFD